MATETFERTRLCVETFVLILRTPESQAANFGKSFLDLYNPTDFVNMGKTLKVLNAVRQFEVGIPLTLFQ